MSNIELHQPSSTRLPARQQRAHNAAVARVVAETKLSALKVDAQAALTGRIMERVVDIDSYRRSLAGQDEVLNAILLRVEGGFVTSAERIQRNLGSEFGL